MNRFVVYIIACITLIILPICFVLYGIWDSHQPKVGPVGDWPTKPAFVQLIPFITTMLIGCLNLPLAIIKYKRNKTKK